MMFIVGWLLGSLVGRAVLGMVWPSGQPIFGPGAAAGAPVLGDQLRRVGYGLARGLVWGVAGLLVLCFLLYLLPGWLWGLLLLGALGWGLWRTRRPYKSPYQGPYTRP